jgi:hypothetical protein
MACATFDRIPQPSDSPTPSSLSATLSVQGGETLALGSGTRASALSGDLRNAAEKGVRESDAFSRIVLEGKGADCRIIVDVRKHQGPMYGGLLCLASGFLIPCTIDYRIVVTTRVEAVSGASGASVVRTHTYRAWYELLLFPYWPARSPFRHGMNAIEMLTKDSLTEAASACKGM